MIRPSVLCIALLAAPAQAQFYGAPPDDGAARLAQADPAAGERVWRTCRACHGIEPGRHGVGPSMAGIVGAPVAAQPGYSYSPALAALGGTWTVARLDAFLENPRNFGPGGRMTFAGIRNPQDRLNLIAWLALQGR